MAGEWAEMPLGDVITLQRGFDLPSQNRKPGKVPIVSSSGISDYHSEVGVKGPGVVTGRYGTIGQVFLIKEDYWPLNTTLWVKDFHGNDPHFASYLLRTVDFQSCSDKSSVPGVNRNDLHRIPVLLPPLAEQKAIAAVLGALDDKIELNRRMNATLEAMARALFQSWFVDFDPVRQNMDAKPCLAGRQAATSPIPEAANLPAGEAGGKWFTYAIECQGGSLYIGQTDNLRRRWKQHVDGKRSEWTKAHPPVALVFWETHDSLEAAVAREAKLKSGSGREWMKQKIAERTSVRLPAGEAGAKLDGRPPAALDPATAALFPDCFQDSTAGHIPSGWRVMKVGEFIERLSVGQKYEQKTVSPVGKVPVLDQGKSGVIGFHNNKPGVTATLDKPVAVFANHTCYMRLITHSFSAIQNVLPFVGSGVDTFWAYYATEGRLSFSEYKGHWPDFVIQESVVPPRELTDAFGRLAKPLVAQMRNNEEESRTLATLRDTLLPRLLSGELSVEGATN